MPVPWSVWKTREPTTFSEGASGVLGLGVILIHFCLDIVTITLMEWVLVSTESPYIYWLEIKLKAPNCKQALTC